MIQRINYICKNSKFFVIIPLLIIIHFIFFIIETNVDVNNTGCTKIINNNFIAQTNPSIVNATVIHVRRYTLQKKIKKNSSAFVLKKPLIYSYSKYSNYTSLPFSNLLGLINVFIEFRPPPESVSILSIYC